MLELLLLVEFLLLLGFTGSKCHALNGPTSYSSNLPFLDDFFLSGDLLSELLDGGASLR